MTGKMVRSEKRTAMKGWNRFDYYLNNLNRGMYFISIWGSKEPVSKKILLTKER